jgi:hypothetical protein
MLTYFGLGVVELLILAALVGMVVVGIVVATAIALASKRRP